MMPFALKKQNTGLDMAGPDAMESQTAGKAQTLTRGASGYAEGQRALSPDRNQIHSAPVQMEKDGETDVDAETPDTMSLADRVTTNDSNMDQTTALGGVVGAQLSAIKTGVGLAETAAAAGAAEAAGAAASAGVEITAGAAETIGMGAVGLVTGVVSLVLAAATAKDKHTKNKAYKAHTNGKKMTSKSKAKPETVGDIANYASAKNTRAMFEAWANVMQAIASVASAVLTIVGATVAGVGALVGLVVGAANIGVKALRGLGRTGKAFFKMIMGTRGKNRNTNATMLVDMAMGGNREAAEMLLQMDLGMIFWSAGHAFKRAMTGPQATGADTLRKMGMVEEESLKGADGKQLKDGKDGSTPEDLIEVLALLKERMGSSDPDTKIAAERQYNGLKNEVKGAMRSVV
jgi:hypothetical protein